MSDNQARKLALEASAAYQFQATSLITYQSAGRVIALGDDAALAACDELPQALNITRVSSSDGSQGIEISGYLGKFRVSVTDKHGNIANYEADAILDLHPQARLSREMLPPGYYHAPKETWEAQGLVEELENLGGEFEKPKYFDYDASICAHKVNTKVACRRCIDACPAEAIQSLIDRIEVNPYLCQGGGSCSTVCPSGAIRYLYPNLRDQGKRIREMLKVYRAQLGEQPIILFHGESYSPEAYLQQYDDLLPLQVEELASVGMDLCLSALAYGAVQVVLLIDEQVPGSSRNSINEQIDWVQPLLAGLGMDSAAISSCIAENEIATVKPTRGIQPAIHDMPPGKRNAMFQALDHLVKWQKPQQPVVDLPAPAPFGEVIIDAGKCTLCMACVGACPGRALQDGSNREVPELFFIESNCLQCNACVQTCPEDAITLAPRLVFDAETRNRARALNSDIPFACISCGKPFASTSVIRKIQGKLKDHYMFTSERAMNRLKMCDNCRVADIVQDPQAMGGQFDPLKGFRQ